MPGTEGFLFYPPGVQSSLPDPKPVIQYKGCLLEYSILCINLVSCLVEQKDFDNQKFKKDQYILLNI